MKHKIIIFFIIAECILFSGCSKSKELHQKLIVQAIGIDSADCEYGITIQALDFQNPMNQDEPSIKTMEIKGRTVMEALEDICKKTSLTPVYSQNLVIIIGEEAAKKGVNNFIDFFVRHHETRPKVKICVSKGRASEICNLKSEGKILKAKNICDLIPDDLNSDMLHFVSNLKSSVSDPVCALIGTDGQKENKQVCFKGACLFKSDKCTFFLEDDYARGFMAMKGVPEFGTFVLNLEDKCSVTCEINSADPKICVALKNGIPFFNMQLDLTVSVFSLDKNFYIHDFETIRFEIEEKMSNEIKDLFFNLINVIKNLNVDPLDFGKALRNSYPRYFKSAEEKSEENFNIKDCNFEISNNVKLVIMGKEPV